MQSRKHKQAICWRCLIKSSLFTDLEVVWQFWASRIARVHRDGHEAVGIQFEHRPLEVKVLQLGRDGPLDAEDLLGHDGQHLQLDAVELVKARPRARRGQAFEELGGISPEDSGFLCALYGIKTTTFLLVLLCPWRGNPVRRSSWRRHTARPELWRDLWWFLSFLFRPDPRAHHPSSGRKPQSTSGKRGSFWIQCCSPGSLNQAICYITLHYVSFSRRFYPKRLTISASTMSTNSEQQEYRK